MTCFSIFASGPHLDPTSTSENIWRRSSIEAVIFNCRPHIDSPLILEDFISRSRIPHIICRLKSRSLWSSFGWKEVPALSIRPFQNVQCEVIWLYVLVMSRTRFRVNPHSIVVWMLRNFLLEAGSKSEI